MGRPDGIALCLCTVKLILGEERGAERILGRYHRGWEKVKLSSGRERRCQDNTLVESITVLSIHTTKEQNKVFAYTER